MNWTYILISEKKENWSYVGCSSNLDRRLKEHERGRVKSTKGYRPLKLIYSEKYDKKDDARKRELILKSGFGREEKNSIIKNIFK